VEPATFDLPDLSHAHEAFRDAQAEAALRAEARRARRTFWRELPILLLIALVFAVVIKTFWLQAFYIPSSSMEETLQINDRVLVAKQSYLFGDIGRGDIVVFDEPGGADRTESFLAAVVRTVAESVGLSTPRTEFIKRVIAVGGETVEIVDNRVVVDGSAIDEPYLPPSVRMAPMAPVTIPQGHIWVMGDNRNVSDDSRSFGSVPIDTVVGRAVAIIWPPSRWSGL
jgi:signal peptidase I